MAMTGPRIGGYGGKSDDDQQRRSAAELKAIPRLRRNIAPGTITRLELEQMNEMYSRTLPSFAEVDRGSFETGFKAGLIVSRDDTETLRGWLIEARDHMDLIARRLYRTNPRADERRAWANRLADAAVQINRRLTHE